MVRRGRGGCWWGGGGRPTGTTASPSRGDTSRCAATANIALAMLLYTHNIVNMLFLDDPQVGEEFADCAIRETFEETNLTVGNARYLTVTNDIAMGGDPTKHYVTVYVHTTILPGSGELLNTEPEKCFGWEWMPWSELQRLSSEEPERLFESVAKFAAMYDKFDL